MLKYFYFIGCFLFEIALIAQPDVHTTNKKAEKLYKEAMLLLQQRNFDDALENLTKAVEKDSNFAEAHYQLGLLYKGYKRNIGKVKYHYTKVVQIDSVNVAPSVVRNIGEIYLHEGNYLFAKRFLLKYRKFVNEPKSFLDKTDRLISMCDYAIENMKYPITINPKALSNKVNNHRKQYFPVTTADQNNLVFTVRDFISNQEYEDIYVSRKVNGEWLQPESISDNINKPFQNEGTCSISADGKVLVFTICEKKGAFDSDCDLFISYKEGNVWSKPTNMGNNINSPYWDSQPSLSPDGKTIYFSSKRKGGYGEEDLWMSTMDDNGRWNIPLNLGDLINTPGREVAPFIHPSMSTLYFSSDYHLGYGSFDIFVSYKDSVNWSVPKNLGYPLNTHLEESSIFITPDCKKAFYSAEAQTNNGQERYLLFEFDVPTVAGCLHVSSYTQGTVYDLKTKQPIAAQIELINLSNKQVESRVISDPVNGKYLVVLNENSIYGLYITKPGYLYKSHSFNFENIHNFDPIELDIYLEPIQKGSSITLNNIFFETGKFKLDSKSGSELKKLANFLEQNITLQVEISGHTDNVGSKENNLNLSTKRAESVYDYLIESGIESSRIKYKGYGDTKPLAPNDSEATRQLNRRIECRIL
ncbi:MAG: OmpA family protein [Bacteroidota bacterium]|nr:OmpA family protein [Bacteroidota bacterium]